jgi:quercetin dioxygenase-like cupin family protein
MPRGSGTPASPPGSRTRVPDPPPILRESLLSAALAAQPAVARVEMTRIQLAPSQQTGLHLHPCDVVGCVLEGRIRFAVEGERERDLGPGDAFHEPANARVAHFDNASPDEPATFVACYLLPQGEERLIVMLDR